LSTSNNPSRHRTPTSKSRFKHFPRHFLMQGKPILGITAALNLPRTSSQNVNHRNVYDEVKVGDFVMVGDKEVIRIKINGEEYFIAYRNRLVKVDTKL